MYKSLLDVFTEKQMRQLQARMWWVANQDKPYLIKFAHDNDFALLELTNLKYLWVARIPIKTLLEDKKKFAKSLQIKENKDLMALFESLLTASDKDARYNFDENSHEGMSFTFEKRIEIFDFKWVFKLQKVTCNPVELICRELLSPLAAVLQAQTRRIRQLRARLEQTQKEYVRRMTEMEKNLYNSPLFETKEDWAKLIPKSEGRLLMFYEPDEASKFFFSNLSSTEVKAETNILPVYNSEHKKKEVRYFPEPDPDRFEIADDIWTEQLEMQKARKMKKEKKIDFI